MDEVESCSDGKEAGRAVRTPGEQNSHDAGILDLTIPGGMGGKEASVLILKIDPMPCDRVQRRFKRSCRGQFPPTRFQWSGIQTI
jgi:hypothetical protein